MNVYAICWFDIKKKKQVPSPANLYLQYDWQDTKETNWGSKDYIKKPAV